MTDEEFEILRAAVTLSRNLGIRKVALLRAELALRYPGKDQAIGNALTAWATYATRKDAAYS